MQAERVSISAFVDPDDHERLVDRAWSSARGRFADRGQLEAAVARGVLVPLLAGGDTHFAIDPQLERIAAPLSENPSTYVALRPRAARLLVYLTRKVYEREAAKSARWQSRERPTTRRLL